MTLASDAAFAIGRTHAVCQDYARAGVAAGRPFAALSDGCSSSPDTDFGARLLVTAAMQSLERFGRVDEQWLLWRAEGRVPEGVPRACLDATLLVTHESADGLVHALAVGDGVLVARHRSGDVKTWEIDCGGAPSYLSYFLDPTRLDRYVAEGYGQRAIVHRVNGEVLSTDVAHLGARLEEFRWERSFDMRDHDLVMWLSDGALSFQVSSTLAGVSLAEVIPHLVDVRVRAGAFLARSQRFFLTKTCPRLGWHHYDDLAAAAIIDTEDVEPGASP